MSNPQLPPAGGPGVLTHLVCCDVNGLPRGKYELLPLKEAPGNFQVCAANWTDGFDGSPAPSVAAAMRFPDVLVGPVGSGLVWDGPDGPEQVFLCDVVGWVPADTLSPRRVLSGVVDAVRARGFDPIVACELEFYLLDSSGQPHGMNAPLPYSMAPHTDPGAAALRILRGLDAAGLPVIAASHEGGSGQFEINLTHRDALTAADESFLLKYLVKRLAANEGLLATFMAQPFAESSGSGLHLHVSLTRDGANIFDDPAGAHGLSKTAQSFIAGVLEHAAGLMALAAPTTNSYKRLRLGDVVPQAADWGLDDRTRFVRVPGERGVGARAEVRIGDASANLYLTTAATLIAGMDGIERGLELEQRTGGASPLPRSLAQALDALGSDKALLEGLGEGTVAQFIEVKDAELDREKQHITDWEVREYRDVL